MVVCLLWRKSEFYSLKPDLRLDRDPRGPGAALHLDLDPSTFLVLGPGGWGWGGELCQATALPSVPLIEREEGY